MADSAPQTPLTELLQGRYAQYTARGGSPETLARETGLHEETIRKYRVGKIPQPQYRGLVLLGMGLGISQNELETAALSPCPSYHALLNRSHLRQAGILATRVDDAFIDGLRLQSEHTIRRLMAALHAEIESYSRVLNQRAGDDAERREALVQQALDAQIIAQVALRHRDDGAELAAGTDRVDRAAAGLDHAIDTPDAPVPDEDEPPSDEDGPQSGQAG